jgi:hypothetical protein
MNRVFRSLLLLVLIVGPVTVHAQQHVRGSRSGRAPVIVAPVTPRLGFVSPYYVQPPLPYDFYYQRELQKRLHAPRATQSFEGSSPSCPRFFCEEGQRP